MGQVFQVIGPQEGQGDFIPLAVAVGVLVLEGLKRLFQFFMVLGQAQFQFVQPGLVDPQRVLRRRRFHKGQGGNPPSRQGDGPPDVRPFCHQRA